jgi:hypothetical protein
VNTPRNPDWMPDFEDPERPPAKEVASARRSAAACSSVGGDFYQGIEWLACWLLDNVEGETITEEQLRPWAQKAWLAHLDRKNA